MSNFNGVSSNIILINRFAFAMCNINICCATTDNTSASIQLKSLNITQAPVCINPFEIQMQNKKQTKKEKEKELKPES